MVVTLDVQPNDETIETIDLTLGDHMIRCRGVSSDRSSPVGLAESSVDYECPLNTAAVMGECMGTQLMPAYANGDYALGATMTTSEGATRTTLASQAVTLNNHGYVMITHHEGKFIAHEGRNFHGGPTSDDNMNSFSACPVSYTGTTVGELSLEGLHSDGGTALSFKVSKDDDGKTIKDGPFTWNLKSENNAMVENTAGNHYMVVNTGVIKDDGGLLVTDEFRAGDPATAGPFQFDFKAPSADSVTVNGENVAAGTTYSAGNKANSNKFAVAGAMDTGVGVDADMTMIAVGDCAMNEHDPDEVDRTKVGFKAIDGYGNVKAISELAEDDGARDEDKNGVDCYVAELAQLKDKLGNAWVGGKTPASWLQTNNFGVDKTAPVMSEADPDNGMVFSALPSPTFDVDNPDLASGDDSGDLSGTAKVGKEVVGDVKFDGRDNREGTVTFKDGTKAFEKEGAKKTVVVTVSDGASPPNTDSHTYVFGYDKTPATFTVSRSQGSVDVPGADAVSVSIAGALSDQSEIEKAALRLLLKSAKGDAVKQCSAATDTLPTARLAKHKRNLENGSNSVSFDETFTIKAPGTDTKGSGPENFCFVLSTEDVAVEADGKGDGNKKDFIASDFTVTWPEGPPIPKKPKFMLTDGADLTTAKEVTKLEAAEGGTAVTYYVSLKDVDPAPTSTNPDTVSISGSQLVTVAPATLTFNSTAPQQVTVTAVHDLDMVSETITLSHTATGYDTASIKVELQDDDMALSVDKSTIHEDALVAPRDDTLRIITLNTGSPVTADSIHVTYTVGAIGNTTVGPSGSDDVAIDDDGDRDGNDQPQKIITIKKGQTSGVDSIYVKPRDDTAIDENNEGIQVSVGTGGITEYRDDPDNPGTALETQPTILAPVGHGRGLIVASTEVKIIDADPDITLSLDQTSVKENTGTATDFLVTAELLGRKAPQIIDITVSGSPCRLVGGTQDADNRATWSNAALNINADESRSTPATISVTPAGDITADLECDVTGSTTVTKPNSTVVYSIKAAKFTIIADTSS